MFPDDPNADHPSVESRDLVRDRRVRPRGVLPRHLQTWVMAGVAAAMLVIIVITGRPAPARRPSDASPAPASTSSLPPERLRRYQEQLAEQEARLRQELADTQAAAAAAAQPTTPPKEVQPSDPIADEQHRRAYTSLFAENVAFTRRSGSASPDPAVRQAAPAPQRVADRENNAPAPRQSGAQSAEPRANPANRPTEDARRLLEGTVIEAVLTNRLDGSFAGPLNALVTSPVYAQDRQSVVIPSGARVLGTAAPVQAFGESRLAVRFHRLVMPDGVTYSLDQFTGLNERGDAGLKDLVDRHYLQLFGASIAIGTLSGLAQYSTRSGASGSYAFSDAFGQGLGGSLASSGGRILDRFLNVLPTVTIREGHRIKIYLTNDIDLPPYRDQ
jgi:type IV secretion system protein VirB10